MMTQPNRPGLGAVKEPTLRRRDWILLPAVGILAILLLAVSAELISRWLYPLTEEGFQNCYTNDNPRVKRP